MEMSDEQIVPASQAEVWRGLNDPEILKACIVGCESLERVSDTEFTFVAGVAVGPVKAKFKGTLTLADLDPPNSYSMTFDTQAGAAGFGKGSAKVVLTPEGESTRLRYTVSAQIGGKLAQVGARLIDGVAKKMANDFFSAFNRKLTESTPAAANEPEAPATDAVQPANARPDVEADSKTRRLWWLVALIVAVTAVFLIARFA